jgi:hypothetical protein
MIHKSKLEYLKGSENNFRLCQVEALQRNDKRLNMLIIWRSLCKILK